jgi:hypothetical protein
VVPALLLFKFNLGQLNHLKRGTVLEQAVSLQDEAIAIPVLAAMNGDVYGLLQLLQSELVNTLLEIGELYSRVVTVLTTWDDVEGVEEVVEDDAGGSGLGLGA